MCPVETLLAQGENAPCRNVWHNANGWVDKATQNPNESRSADKYSISGDNNGKSGDKLSESGDNDGKSGDKTHKSGDKLLKSGDKSMCPVETLLAQDLCDRLQHCLREAYNASCRNIGRNANGRVDKTTQDPFIAIETIFLREFCADKQLYRPLSQRFAQLFHGVPEKCRTFFGVNLWRSSRYVAKFR